MKGEYEKALMYARKDPPQHDRALDLLSRASARGDARATYALATWYLHGHVVAKNIRTGTTLLRRAAQGEVPEAVFDLAVSYETGVGVARSERQAAKLYLKAALLGDREAMHSVGRCLYHGIGFVRDRVQAAVWLGQAESATRTTRARQHRSVP